MRGCGGGARGLGGRMCLPSPGGGGRTRGWLISLPDLMLRRVSWAPDPAQVEAVSLTPSGLRPCPYPRAGRDPVPVPVQAEALSLSPRRPRPCPCPLAGRGPVPDPQKAEA